MPLHTYAMSFFSLIQVILVRVLQKKRTSRISHTYTHRRNIIIKNYDPVITETLPSASWRPRKAGGVIQSKSEGSGELMAEIPVQRQEKIR